MLLCPSHAMHGDGVGDLEIQCYKGANKEFSD